MVQVLDNDKKEAKPSLAAVPKTSKKPRKSSESDDKPEK